jgi:hypothetical protein
MNTASTTEPTNRIFLSYRREDTAYPAGWLFDRLVEHFGDGQVFKDVDSIQPGDDFVRVITAAVTSCAVVLTLIGPRWLTAADEEGQRRLDGSGDFVRLEIEAAFARGVRVIPVLVDGAQMPHDADLPASLAQLARRQALELTSNRFGTDAARLLAELDKTLGETGVASTEPLGGTGRPRARSADRRLGAVNSPTPQAPHQVAQPKPNGGAQPLAAHRNIASYWRFWIGLLFITGGLVCFIAKVPHQVGYHVFVETAKADTYTGVALAALMVLGVLLLLGALISASRAAGAPRVQR